MVKATARACYSLALLACSNPRLSGGTCAFVVRSNSYFLYNPQQTRLTGNTHRISRPFSSSSIVTMSSNTKIDVASNLDEVRTNIAKVVSKEEISTIDVQLVAVSKTKPMELLLQAYEAGQRVFGENYVQELVGKVAEMPHQDVMWHYIGPLQSNKANLLVKSAYPKLCVETVASIKLANKLNNAVQLVLDSSEKEDGEPQKLDIYVQVNTSGEDSKSGVTPGSQTLELSKHILGNCPNLHLVGLMTIGAPNDTSCFDVLAKCRDDITTALELSTPLQLSMGMSGDYEQAIAHGATSVRVGSTIFGARDYSNVKK
mmetsp:Transcript_7708/g.11074  ORF Transcript_7708/g.11074 Transcript_7708/m.11074 type:complete len:315 (-) Transcript_7708:84-1028(-)